MMVRIRQILSSNKVFAKSLPFLGHFSNISSMLAAGGITYMALMIAASNKNDVGRSTSVSSIIRSVVGTILNSFIAVVMYIYSDASKMLFDIGTKIDESLSTERRNYQVLSVSDREGATHKNYYRDVMGLLIASGICANILIIAVRTHQESILLLDKYLDLSPEISESEKQQTREALLWLIVYNFVFVGAYSNLAFQGCFALNLFEDITKKKEHPTNQSPSDISEHIESRASLLLFSEQSNMGNQIQSSTRSLLNDNRNENNLIQNTSYRPRNIRLNKRNTA